MIYFSTLLLSLFITLALIPLFMKQAVRLNGIDIPDERKVHTHPIPRTGGIALALGILIPILFWITKDPLLLSLIMGVVVVVLSGVIDDIRSLGYKAKFLAQFSAALIVVVSGAVKIQNLGNLLPPNYILPDWISIPLTIIFLVGVTNAINLADGLDGLAAGISLLSFCCIGYLAYISGNITIVILSMAITGSIFGFLRFNTWPASVFMGDAGSQTLGFLAGCLSVRLTQGNTPLSPILPLIILGFPVLDTLTVMGERIYKGISPFKADKNHFHHRLLKLGFFHTEAVLIIYILQSFFIISAYIFRFHTEWFLLFFYMIFSSFILLSIFIAEKRDWQIKRFSIFDVMIKGKLRNLKEQYLLIKVFFRAIYIGIPFMLIFSTIILYNIPRYFSFFSLAAILILFSLLFVNKKWLKRLIQPFLYIFIPFVIYFSHRDMVTWMDKGLFRIYNGLFGILVLLVILTLKFTRRRNGFKSNPMDFLILFIALVVPNLPNTWIQSYHMGLVAVKIIVLFFSYEVLIGELRGKLNEVALSSLVAMAIICIKGLL